MRGVKAIGDVEVVKKGIVCEAEAFQVFVAIEESGVGAAGLDEINRSFSK